MPTDFNDLTYSKFSKLHGGKRTAALAGAYRKRKGLGVNERMREAMVTQATQRAGALEDRQRQQLEKAMGGPDAPPEGTPGKPLPEYASTLGPPDAPKTGDRTKPGTTPRKGGPGGYSTHPWGDGTEGMTRPVVGPWGNTWRPGDGQVGGGAAPSDRIRELVEAMRGQTPGKQVNYPAPGGKKKAAGKSPGPASKGASRRLNKRTH